MFWSTVLGLSCFKALLAPAYRSTDFEVHRNWLAVTHSLPPAQWYTEATSQWTLDYPPLFAWFEWVLAQVAVKVDPAMVRISAEPYASAATVLFQRGSVILTDLSLAWGARVCHRAVAEKARADPETGRRVGHALLLLVLGNAGLIIVDHIHFQYNGFLFGILLVSVGKMLQDKPVQSAFWFAVLLNLKHIYIYCAPAYFVYLLRTFCFPGTEFRLRNFSPSNLSKLAAVVVLVFAASFGPFIYDDRLWAVLGRLFPFKRGLCHAYWAPNFWALYNVADKAALAVLRRIGLFVPSISSEPASASMTGGLVQEFKHSLLPSVAPWATFALTLLAQLPALVKLWTSTVDALQFLRAVVLCSWAAFLFGWHVHEKAVLLVIVPMTLLAVLDRRDASVYLLTSTVGHFSLFPLLFRAQETSIKVLLVISHALAATKLLTSLHDLRRVRGALLRRHELVYLAGLAAVFAFQTVIQPRVAALQRWPFAPLIGYSVYCALGLAYAFAKMYIQFLRQ